MNYAKVPFSGKAYSYVWILLIWATFISIGYAQNGKFESNEFYTSGMTVKSGADCFKITPAINWSSGGVWYRDPVDLHESFEMELDILFGCKDAEGADGLVFIFSPFNGLTGRPGEGMGFGGLYPSLGIEIDTWQNFHLSDPYEDHVALLRDGYVDHFSNLAGPNIIKNIEDCKLHNLNISWNQKLKILEVKIDKESVLKYQGNLLSDVFGDRDQLYWGITAATGKFNNRHELCFKKLDFTPPLKHLEFTEVMLTQLEQSKMISLDDLEFNSGSSIVQKKSKGELYKILNMMQAHPNNVLDIYGHTDNVGQEALNQKISYRRAKVVADFLISHGIDPERLNVQGFGEAYPRSTNKSAEGRKRNRRVDIKFYKPRT